MFLNIWRLNLPVGATDYAIKGRHELKLKVEIIVITCLMIVNSSGCGPIITGETRIAKAITENSWREVNNREYCYDCNDLTVSVDLPEIHGSGVWFAFFLLPIAQGSDNRKRLSIFLKVMDNKTHLPFMNPFKADKETVKISANNQLYLSERYNEIETSDYMGEGQARHSYSFYVYDFDISELNTGNIGIVFPKDFILVDKEHDKKNKCSIPDLDIQIEDRISFGMAIPGHASEIFSIKE
jgi:hypothetical protein